MSQYSLPFGYYPFTFFCGRVCESFNIFVRPIDTVACYLSLGHSLCSCRFCYIMQVSCRYYWNMIWAKQHWQLHDFLKHVEILTFFWNKLLLQIHPNCIIKMGNIVIKLFEKGVQIGVHFIVLSCTLEWLGFWVKWRCFQGLKIVWGFVAFHQVFVIYSLASLLSASIVKMLLYAENC